MSDRNYAALRDPEVIEKFIDRIIAGTEGTAFAKSKPFAFDIEAGYTGPDQENVSKMQFHPNYILVGISFTSSTEWARYVPIAHDDGNNATDIPRVARAFWRLVNTGCGIAHNIAYELKGMSRWFREVLWNDPEVGAEVRESKGLFPFLADTMLCVWISQEYEPAVADITQKDLKSSVWTSFGIKMTKFKELFPKDDSDMGPKTKAAEGKLRFNTRYSNSARVIAYACEDSVGSLLLYEKHYDELMEGPRALITKVEHQLVPVLVEMEMGPLDDNGVAQGNMFLNWAHIFQKEEELERFREKFQEEILTDFSKRLNRVVTLNLNSVPQMVKILYGDAPEGLGLPINDRFRSKITNAPSTGDDALKVLANTDPLIRKILDYRQVVKLYGSYLHKYSTQLNYAGTGFVFPNHNQAGTVTGRMSVDGVSYQQWPKPQHYELDDGTTFDMNFRDLLISPDEYRIVGYDYSQVELRFLAGVSGEDTMLQAFASGTDIHRLTASRMFKIPIEQVTKSMRSKGKTINFAIVYGQGPEALAESLSAGGEPTTKEEAIELLEKYFAGFPKLRAWIDEQKAIGHNQGWVETFFGRKFVVWEYKDHRQWIRDKGDRMTVNAPIQGGAADYMKIAMVRVFQALKKHGLQHLVRLTMTIHDALEFYVHKSVTTQQVIEIVNPAVSYAVKGLPVQIRADWHEGPTWGMMAEVKIDPDAQITHYELEDVDGEYSTYDEAMTDLFKRQAEKDKKPTKGSPTLTVDEALTFTPTTLRELFEWHHVDPDMRIHLVRACEKDADTPDEEVKLEADRIGGWDLIFKLKDEMLARVDQVVERPMALEDDAPWMAHHQETKTFFIVLTEMPDKQQWADFKDWLRPGEFEVVVRTPEGDIRDDKRYAIGMDDQGLLSLLLGGADVYFETNGADIEAVASGVEL